MATYGQGLRISGQVSAAASASGTLYTVPAGRYAIFNWVINPVNSSGSGTLAINGTVFAKFAPATAATYFGSATADPSGSSVSPAAGSGVIHAGPGAVISTAIVSSCTVSIEGCEFES